MKSLLPPSGCLIDQNLKINVYLLVFFVIISIILAYSIGVLSNIGNILIKGSKLDDVDFQSTYHISRARLQRYQIIFTVILGISGAIVLSVIWSSLPSSVRCWLFNNYTILFFVILVFIITIKVLLEISPKHFANEFVRISNIIVLSLTSVALFIYILVIIMWLTSKKSTISGSGRPPWLEDDE
jgi:hypothetical protein